MDAPSRSERLSYRILEPDDGPDLQDLLESDRAYFETVHGYPPDASLSAEAQSLYSALPTGKSYEDKWLVGGSLETGGLVIVADVIREYPDRPTWTLGWLFVRPVLRRQGFADEASAALEAWFRRHGARRIRASVAASNDGAVRFLEGRGYAVVERRPEWRLGNRTDDLVVFERPA